MLAMAENHINTDSIGLQCVVQCVGTECTITDMNEPLIPSTSASQTPNPAFRTTKNSGLKKS